MGNSLKMYPASLTLEQEVCTATSNKRKFLVQKYEKETCVNGKYILRI
jgi:hypothetical protein